VVVVVGAGDMPPSNFLHRLLRLLIAGAIFCFKKILPFLIFFNF
jgi:hypothetical protein